MSATQITGTIARYSRGQRVEGVDFYGRSALRQSLGQMVEAALGDSSGLTVGDIDRVAGNLLARVESDYQANPHRGIEIVDIKHPLHLTVDFA